MLNTAGPLESRLVANTTGFPLSKSLALSPWMECNGNGDVKRWAGISMILSFLLQNNEMFICLPIICLAGKLSRRLLEEGEEASLVGMVNTSSRSSTATQTSVTSDSDRINTSVVLCKRQKKEPTWKFTIKAFITVTHHLRFLFKKYHVRIDCTMYMICPNIQLCPYDVTGFQCCTNMSSIPSWCTAHQV